MPNQSHFGAPYDNLTNTRLPAGLDGLVSSKLGHPTKKPRPSVKPGYRRKLDVDFDPLHGIAQ